MLFGGEDEDIARQVIFEEVSERERESHKVKKQENPSYRVPPKEPRGPYSS